MLEVKKIKKTERTNIVYDISLDGTVVNALGNNILSNTDGFDFAAPAEYRYTEENPYVSIGKGRNYPKGKTYTGVIADIAEFEDLYLNNDYYDGINKAGLGLDDYIPASAQIARKNYFEYLEDGTVKIVGNTLKSKKMPIYIEKFIDMSLPLILKGKGKEFLELYYDYVEKIYNLQIPLKDIATVGKIKTSIENYKEGCKKLTAGGTKKSRQAWYELAIKDNLSVNMGDAIYYINTGKSKSSSDVQRVTNFFIIKNGQKQYDVIENGELKTDRKGNPVSLFKEIDKQYKKFKKDNKENTAELSKYKNAFEYGKGLYPDLQEEDTVIFNCVRLSNEIIEDEDDHFCNDNFEYNSDKYIDMFNKRIKPLLVCFDKSIRTVVNEKGKEVNNILITNPKDRKTFTDEESKLVSGQPYNVTDQDTYEQLMTMEDKEIRFWLSVDKIPPYAEECGMNWEEVKEDYLKRMKELEREEIQQELKTYETILENIKKADLDKFIEEGAMPDKLSKIVTEDMENGDFISKKYGVKIGSIYDFVRKDFCEDDVDEEID